MPDRASLLPGNLLPPSCLFESLLLRRAPLLREEAIPFDSVKDADVPIGRAAALQSAGQRDDPAEAGLDSVQIARRVLDHAVDAADAVSLFGDANLDADVGPGVPCLVPGRPSRAARSASSAATRQRSVLS